MRIAPYDRVVYEKNPLAEVVCQIRFAKTAGLTDEEKSRLQAELLRLGYPALNEEVALGFPKAIALGDPRVRPQLVVEQTTVRHFSSSDGAWRVSVGAEFVALTCHRYQGWDYFLPRLLEAATLLLQMRPDTAPSRLGLRYKDVVEREPLGLEGVGWHELVSGFLLGPLAPGALADDQTPLDDEVGSFLSQALLRLDGCMLLLQSSLLTSVDRKRRAFLIDADFFNEGDVEVHLLQDQNLLRSKLHTLHANAGALFRRCISERLHSALRPRH